VKQKEKSFDERVLEALCMHFQHFRKIACQISDDL
jgi:hypothetical protein